MDTLVPILGEPYFHSERPTPNSWIELHGQIFHLFSSILYGCARILQWSFSKSSKSSIAGKHERNRYKCKFPEAPASATRAQPLSSGAMHDSMYGPVLAASTTMGRPSAASKTVGGPPSAAPHCFGFHGGGCCHIWDHISYHAWHQNLTVAPALRSPEVQET